MPKFRCDFEVDSDMVLPTDREMIRVGSDDGVTLVLRNGGLDPAGHVTTLIASVIGEATSLDTARDTMARQLASKLDLLAFSTQSRFKIKGALRLIEWGPFEKSRNFRAFHTVDMLYPPHPELSEEFLKTACSLDSLTLPPFTRSALHYFRIGMLDKRPEDQFMHMWLALEIIAENTKSNSKENIFCEECARPAKCAGCGHEPQRVPMATFEIKNIISRFSGRESSDLSKRLLKTRHALMHGREPKEILNQYGVSLADIANELGSVTWSAIFSTIPIPEDLEVVFGHRDGEFFTPQLVISTIGNFEHKGSSDHPSEEEIPKISMSIETTFTGQPPSGV